MRNSDGGYEDYSIDDDSQWNGLYKFQSNSKVEMSTNNGDLNLNHKYYIKLKDGELLDYVMPEINVENKFTGKTTNDQLLGVDKIYKNGVNFKFKRDNLISDLNGVLKKRNDTIFLRFQYFNNESVGYWYMYKEK
ncbi:MAG: hypothetical protein ACSHWW_00475 [Nonlabens sp.]|uniref:hypothetical protein n=1 Tax=Nonlabens sp. TaxID=1888209 RepID=UPI003EF2D470